MSIPNVTLNDGHQLPNLGLGTINLKVAQDSNKFWQQLKAVIVSLIQLLITTMKELLVKQSVILAFHVQNFTLPQNCLVNIMTMKVPVMLSKNH